jgi:6-phosphofructokinase 1
LDNETNRMTAYVNRIVVSSPIDDAYGVRRPFNRRLYDLINELSI